MQVSSQGYRSVYKQYYFTETFQRKGSYAAIFTFAWNVLLEGRNLD